MVERKKFENMESLDRWKWHFQSLLIHTSFGSFYLDIQNHTVEYPRVRGCSVVACSDVLINTYFWLNLMQMKSLLIIVKMCNKANIFKNQLGYLRNP